MLSTVLYVLGVVLIVLGIIGFFTDLGTGVGLTGLIVGIVLVLVAKFAIGGRSRV